MILDNSVIELGYPMAPPEIIKAAKTVKASEVVVPDMPRVPEFTMSNLVQDGPTLRRHLPDTRLMAVPQGRTVQEWLECHDAMLRLGFVDTIGIGKFLKGLRPDIVKATEKMIHFPTDALLRADAYHLLGTWGNPIEIADLSAFSWIRGVDSKLPVRLGLRGIALHPELGMLSRIRPEPMHFEDDSDPMPHITSWNVGVFDAWAQNIPVTFEDFDWNPSTQQDDLAERYWNQTPEERRAGDKSA